MAVNLRRLLALSKASLRQANDDDDDAAAAAAAAAAADDEDMTVALILSKTFRPCMIQTYDASCLH